MNVPHSNILKNQELNNKNFNELKNDKLVTKNR
jgi:hypothetical protein